MLLPEIGGKSRGFVFIFKKTKKWHGHLYNWYDIKSKKAIYPSFISTIDSGNLVSCLIVTKEFLIKEKADEKTIRLCEKLIKNTNFKKL